MIAENMKKILLREKRKNIWYGDIFIIEECAKMSNIKHNHPKKRIKAVLDALDRSEDFKKSYIITDFDGYKRKYRCFTMKEDADYSASSSS